MKDFEWSWVCKKKNKKRGHASSCPSIKHPVTMATDQSQT